MLSYCGQCAELLSNCFICQIYNIYFLLTVGCSMTWRNQYDGVEMVSTPYWVKKNISLHYFLSKKHLSSVLKMSRIDSDNWSETCSFSCFFICLTNVIIVNTTHGLWFIHKYLRQFRYFYWWRARHVGVFKQLIMISWSSVYNRLFSDTTR